MKNRKLKFNVFFNNEKEDLEKLVIQSLINYFYNNTSKDYAKYNF